MYDERRMAQRLRDDGYNPDEIDDRLSDYAEDEIDRLRDEQPYPWPEQGHTPA